MNLEQKAHSTIDAFLLDLKSRGFKVSTPQKGNYSFYADIKISNESFKILVYFGKKGIKTVLQGDLNSTNYSILSEIIYGKSLFENKTSIEKEPDEYIGTDESGKGDYFGPLVIAGAYINESIRLKLPLNEIKDSKLLTDENILKLAPRLRNLLDDKFDIVMVTPQKYNQLYKSFNNLNKLLAWGHSTVIENILKKQNTKTVISDKFADDRLILNALKEKGKLVDLIQTTKAERFLGVAIASIIAREKFLHWFINVKKKLNLTLPKGASSSVNKTAKEIANNSGKEYLENLVKLHFK
ncbi:MAG: ribonuclease HIII, partial [Ignavibacteriaceae bacterium]|nr:ribonuclease HIII [Ignavibacteriaceae bacterium]